MRSAGWHGKGQSKNPHISIESNLLFFSPRLRNSDWLRVWGCTSLVTNHLPFSVEWTSHRYQHWGGVLGKNSNKCVGDCRLKHLISQGIPVSLKTNIRHLFFSLFSSTIIQNSTATSVRVVIHGIDYSIANMMATNVSTIHQFINSQETSKIQLRQAESAWK